MDRRSTLARIFSWLEDFRARQTAPLAAEEGVRGYVICTSPRSGSNMLCAALAATGQLGHPKEYFNRKGRIRYDGGDYPRSPKAQVVRAITDGRTPNGVYALKIFARQSHRVMRTAIWHKLLPRLSFVYLTRDDLLGQAISLDIARRTNRYRSTDPSVAPPSYDGVSLQRTLDHLASENAGWERFFLSHGISPLRLNYEQVSSDLPGAVQSIASLVGVSGVVCPQDPMELEVQRTSLNSEWRARYLSGDRSCGGD